MTTRAGTPRWDDDIADVQADAMATVNSHFRQVRTGVPSIAVYPASVPATHRG